MQEQMTTPRIELSKKEVLLLLEMAKVEQHLIEDKKNLLTLYLECLEGKIQ